jgi:ABC-type lipopolysaccharide export system ATPase subunit
MIVDWNQIQKHLSWWFEYNRLSYVQRAQHGIGYLAQEASVLKIKHRRQYISVLQPTNLQKEQEAKMESLIDEFGLEHIRTNEVIYFRVVSDVVLKLHDV